eukprot:TRINITY_DN11963_c0_g5_i1.p2 TRINITY_DN11963_c0_g5~~TRINITY_DN11963_c0_g5_i1.p2  ORF type:complete len:134 (+),score=4.58 TRINITY_DN11963_c0_g5_i1:781-1182(+)
MRARGKERRKARSMNRLQTVLKFREGRDVWPLAGAGEVMITGPRCELQVLLCEKGGALSTIIRSNFHFRSFRRSVQVGHQEVLLTLLCVDLDVPSFQVNMTHAGMRISVPRGKPPFPEDLKPSTCDPPSLAPC